MKKYFLFIIILAFGCTNETNSDDNGSLEEQSKSVHFRRSDYGDKWPFNTINEGDVHCIDGFYVVFFAKNGPIYALNGNANMKARTEGVWKKLGDEHIVGKDISPMLDAGLKLCK